MSHNEDDKQPQNKQANGFGINKIIGVLIIVISLLLYISLLSR